MTVLRDSMEISASALAALVRNSDRTTLIVDCRCCSEFNQSHVRYAVNSFFSKMMRRRLFENKSFYDYSFYTLYFFGYELIGD
uniref:Rhodanese domain-containing protein n=1 Tax=Heterorhabditis bacteriophora TaxID=37862 RepID=A0A1I7XA84_HETBA